jgi:hypothetical protein
MNTSNSEHPAQSLDTGVTNSAYMLLGKLPNSHSILLLCQTLQLVKFTFVAFIKTTLAHNPMSSKIHLYSSEHILLTQIGTNEGAKEFHSLQVTYSTKLYL